MAVDPLLRYLARPTRSRYAALVKAHYRYVWSFALRVSGNEDDASDLTQEVFLKLLLEPPVKDTVKSPRGFLAWKVLGRTGRLRRAVERRRRREDEHARRIADRIAGPMSAAREDDAEAVRSALGELPDEDRTALELRYMAGLDASEIASVYGVSDRAIRQRLQRARDRLRRRLGPHVSGVLLGVAPTGLAEAAPPSDLLPGLLKMHQLGPTVASVASTSAATSTPLKLGGLVMSVKKLAVSVALAIAVCCGLAVYLVDRGDLEEGPAGRELAGTRQRTTPRAVTPERSYGAAGATAEKTPSAAEDRDDRRPSISGRITGASGADVPGAEVWALEHAAWTSPARDDATGFGAWRRDSDEGLSELRRAFEALVEKTIHTTADSDGRYALPGLVAGDYRLVVLEPGYLLHDSTRVSFDGRTPLERDIALASGASIEGRVVDGQGAPVAGARILWRVSDERPLTGSALLYHTVSRWERGWFLRERRDCRSQPDGSFRIPSLEPRHYDLEARVDNHAKDNAWHVAAGTNDVRLVLETGLSVRGRVVDESGAPVAGARIRVAAAREPEVHRYFDSRVGASLFPGSPRPDARAGAGGRFHIAGLESGHWDLEITPETEAPLHLTFELEGQDLDLGDVVARAPGSISGVVETETGEPIESARVWAARPLKRVYTSNSIVSSVPDALVETESTASGAFELTGLPPGSFPLYADHPLYRRALSAAIVTGQRNVSLVLARGRTIRGRVLDDASGEGVSGARIRVGFSGDHETESVEAGQFTVHGLAFEDAHRGGLTVRVSHDEFDTASETLLLAASPQEQEVVIRLTRNEWVNGRVVDPEGEGVGGVLLAYEAHGLPPEAAGYNPVRGLRGFSEADGSFRLRAPGELRRLIGEVTATLVARREGYSDARVELAPFPPVGEPWPDVELTLRPGLKVSGRVHDEEGRPVAGALVRAAPDGEDANPAAREIDPRAAISDRTGRFSLAHVLSGPGVVHVSVLARGYAVSSLTVEVTRDGEPDVDITLQRGRSLEGRVTDHAGNPLPGAEVVVVGPSFAEWVPDPEEGTSEPLSFSRRMELLLAAGSMRARTGEDGSYTLENLPQAELPVVARLAGYEPAIVLASPRDARLSDIALSRFSAIAGRVIDAETRAPVTGFTVDLVNTVVRAAEQKRTGMHDSRIGSEGGLVFHDPRGRFFYDGLRPGRYEIRITSPGHVFERRELELAAGEEKDIDFLLRTGGAINVTVVDVASGKPIPEAGVSVSRGGVQDVFAGFRDDLWTDDHGHCRVPALADGEYYVIASHPYYLRDAMTPPALVSVGGDVAETTIKLHPAGRLAGRVNGLKLSREGSVWNCYGLELQPVAEAPSRKQRRPSQSPNVSIGPDGTFSRDSVTPGEYRLVLTRQAQDEGEMVRVGPTSGFAASRPVGEKAEVEAGTITIEAGRTTEFSFRAPAEF